MEMEITIQASEGHDDLMAKNVAAKEESLMISGNLIMVLEP
jgi:hypothetical protein